ncbi:hypothetical protein HYPSUDRAFT_208317 [Hypholoma sublateritium FD-334 SS-4]|uniref:Uncharacterized protein n=1 Tax=Hypholoma sublateritium (strain FD-334 SS-4) TaxID=945553 RepID=A0A0D2P2V6_HYPSF|nr:hypothetical protein HYPSUDRAFT_208317 [Hypholoma sublateritium FD-334 SS-4]
MSQKNPSPDEKPREALSRPHTLGDFAHSIKRHNSQYTTTRASEPRSPLAIIVRAKNIRSRLGAVAPSGTHGTISRTATSAHWGTVQSAARAAPLRWWEAPMCASPRARDVAYHPTATALPAAATLRRHSPVRAGALPPYVAVTPNAPKRARAHAWRKAPWAG